MIWSKTADGTDRLASLQLKVLPDPRNRTSVYLMQFQFFLNFT